MRRSSVLIRVMSKRKGVSADEKKKMLLKVYHTRREPFNNKEIAKEGAKAGLNEKLVPDINQLLIDDNFVLSDKIGSSTFYWCFSGVRRQSASWNSSVEF